MRGSTIDISGNRKATPPQRVKTDTADGTDQANGTNRPAARSKGSQQRETGKAIGASGTPAKPPPPVPRKSRQPASGGDSQTGDGGSE
jgi:hypothetical protein